MKFVIYLTAMLALAGCSVLEQQRPVTTEVEEDVVKGTEGPLPAKAQLHGVPHNPSKQKGPDCAPDSLRMVLTYRGKTIENDQVIPRLLDVIKGGGRGRTGGTTFRQMQTIAVEHFKLPAFIIYNCDLDSLKSAIVNEWPPIVGYRVGGRNYHAVVAVGFDDKRKRMRVHDPNYVRVKDIRYDDLGGLSEDSKQTLTCLLVLPEGSTQDTLRQGLEKYVPKEVVRGLTIYSQFPARN